MTCPRCAGRVIRGSCFACGWEPIEVTAAPIEAREAHKHWTAAEEAFVREHMHQMTGRDLAMLLTETFGTPRSWKSLKHWFARRGLSKPTVRRKRVAVRTRTEPCGRYHGRWSEAETEALEALDFKVLSHRTRAAMEWQAWKLGAPLRSGDGFLSATQVAEMHRIHPQIVTRLIARHYLPAHRNGHLWRIDPADAENVPTLLRRARTPRRK